MLAQNIQHISNVTVINYIISQQIEPTGYIMGTFVALWACSLNACVTHTSTLHSLKLKKIIFLTKLKRK
jgi:hypothetical protein